MYPGKQFGLDIGRCALGVAVAQWSSASYKVVDPELSVGIFGSTPTLLILYSLGYTQTG